MKALHDPSFAEQEENKVRISLICSYISPYYLNFKSVYPRIVFLTLVLLP
jgi:hypothetical protein